MKKNSNEEIGMLNEAIQLLRGAIEAKSALFKPNEILSISEENLINAIEIIRRSQGISKQEEFFLEFLVNIRRYHFSYEKSGELWNFFESQDGPFIVMIDISFLRKTGTFEIIPFSKEITQKMIAKGVLSDSKILNILDSLEDDEMLVRYSDSEYSKNSDFNFSFNISQRKPNTKDEEEIRILTSTIGELLSWDDPISMARGEKVEKLDSETFFSADERNINSAWQTFFSPKLSLKDKDLFQFWRSIRMIFLQWTENKYPWKVMSEKYGSKIEKGYMEIIFDKIHEGGTPEIYPFDMNSIDEMMEESKDADDKRMWKSIRELTISCPTNSLLLNFRDIVKSKQHGFPFDMAMTISK